jgi:release factor glutamine methyltransferase
LAVSLALELREASIWASDVSAETLYVAGLNARRHGVGDRIQFVLADLLQPFKKRDSTFDVILSNPPYVSPQDLDKLAPDVREYEPRLALDGREGGMYYIREIITEAPQCLKPGGWILLEMDPAQTPEALRLIKEAEGYTEERRIRDYSHHYRVVLARKRS